MIIAIDGASRRNGKPDCLAAGGVFIKQDGTYKTAAGYDTPSTNQRGELVGLLAALETMGDLDPQDVILVTDSEYLYNAIYKDWLTGWANKGWKTASGDPVKSQDLWVKIADLLQRRRVEGYDINIYHIKGHLVSLGKVTASNILHKDPSGELLYLTIWEKYEADKLKHPDKFYNAYELFERNHGFPIDESSFKVFVVMNTVADYVAGTYCDKIDLKLRG